MNNILLYFGGGKGTNIEIIHFVIIDILIIAGVVMPTSFQYALCILSIGKKNISIVVSLLWIVLFNAFVFLFSIR
jgi:hypothetical protein